MSELSALVEQLVAIDSVNPTLVPGGAGEAYGVNAIDKASIHRFIEGLLQRLIPEFPGTGDTASSK